jgi:hypothetical protein
MTNFGRKQRHPNHRRERPHLQPVSSSMFSSATGTMKFLIAAVAVAATVLISTVDAASVTQTATTATPATAVNNNEDSSTSSSSSSSSTLRISKNKLAESAYYQQQQQQKYQFEQQQKLHKNKNSNNKKNKKNMQFPSEMMINEEDLPINDSQNKWQSLNKDVEFIPADGISSDVVQRFLEQGDYSYSYGEEEETTSAYGGMSGMDKVYDVEPFAYGVDEYDEYQQAWRLMGFIIDCNPMVDDDYYENGGSGSGDQGTEDGCSRYVLWAAYVDLDYEGGGIGEYQHWNTTNSQWDTSACQYSGSDRCAKMDCHLENTHFSLLGFFKHKSYDDWMEQLFKHEGKCVWTDEEYAFMSNAREAWPQGCIDTYTTTSDGTKEIYYDVKPIQGGDIVVGLYTDTQCIKEYQSTGSSDPISVENILGNVFLDGGGSGDNDNNYDFSGDTLDESMSRWASAFAKFRVCQPCVAYDLENIDGTKFYDDDGGGGGDMFDCYDDADYTNVNQVCTTIYVHNFLDEPFAFFQFESKPPLFFFLFFFCHF